MAESREGLGLSLAAPAARAREIPTKPERLIQFVHFGGPPHTPSQQCRSLSCATPPLARARRATPAPDAAARAGTARADRCGRSISDDPTAAHTRLFTPPATECCLATRACSMTGALHSPRRSEHLGGLPLAYGRTVSPVPTAVLLVHRR